MDNKKLFSELRLRITECKKFDGGEASSTDIRCSTSCVKTGLIILLLSVLNITLVQPHMRLHSLDALLKYASLRFSLEDNLNLLMTDTCWKILNNDPNNHKPGKWQISQLKNYKCRLGEESAPIKKDDIKENTSSTLEHLGLINSVAFASTVQLRPAAPTGLHVQIGINPILEIVQIWDDIGNGELLGRARSYNYKYDRSIYWWIIKYNELRARHMESPPIMIDNENVKPGFEADILVKEMEILTLEELKELSNYQLPDQNDVLTLSQTIDSITLPSTGLTLKLSTAPIFIDISLVVAMLYFWLYQRESKLSKSYGAPGTFWGVFNRTVVARVAFLSLAVTPPVASIYLAIWAFSVTTTVTVVIASLSLSMVVFSLLIVREFLDIKNCSMKGKKLTFDDSTL